MTAPGHGGAPAAEARCEVTIVNKRGLHARASAKFVAAVAAMDGCSVKVAKDGHSVRVIDLRSIVPLDQQIIIDAAKENGSSA